MAGSALRSTSVMNTEKVSKEVVETRTKNFRFPYATSYSPKPFEVESQQFKTKTENDEFASGLELMGAREIIKTYWNSVIGAWFRYHNDYKEEICKASGPPRQLQNTQSGSKVPKSIFLDPKDVTVEEDPT